MLVLLTLQGYVSKMVCTFVCSRHAFPIVVLAVVNAVAYVSGIAVAAITLHSLTFDHII